MAQVKLRRSVFLAALTIGMLMLSGCRPIQAPESTSSEPEQIAQAASDLALVGSAWQVESFGRPEDRLGVIEGSRLTLNFGITRYAGSGGCNWFLGVYGVAGDSLRFRTPALTNSVCAEPPGVMQQEGTYLSALWNIVQYRKEDEKLLGFTTNDQLLITFVPAESIALEGTLWTLRFQVSNGRLAPVSPQTEITAQFADGQLSGTTGCNRYTAGYTLNGDQFALSEVVVTEMACTDERLMRQEERFLANLQSATRLVQTGGLLQLIAAGGETVLAFGIQ